MKTGESSSNSNIGVNLRVTAHCNPGGRLYMEDHFSVAYQQTEDEKDLEYAYFGIFDGHGGQDAALFAKTHLMDLITKQKNFWSDDDEVVLKAIREGFLQTQRGMWGDLSNWKKTGKGYPSTAGTTASVAFIKRGKIFIGHVGDSRIIIGRRDSNNLIGWKSEGLTRDHKPECPIELDRIRRHGGKVVNKSGVPRVVWRRPKASCQGVLRRSTLMDEVPFLAVARALGDLWSYNPEVDAFIVSPEPDLNVYSIDILKDRCLILATDGVWNVLPSTLAVSLVHGVEKNNEKYMLDSNSGYGWINPSKRIVDRALERWETLNRRADNISVLTVMLDPPGRARAQVLKRQMAARKGLPLPSSPSPPPPELPPKPVPKNSSGKNLAIITRFPNSSDDRAKIGTNLVKDSSHNRDSQSVTRIVHDSLIEGPRKMVVKRQSSNFQSSEDDSPPPPLPEKKFGRKSVGNRKENNSQLSKTPTLGRKRSSIDYNSDEENVPSRPLRTRRASSVITPSRSGVLRSKNTHTPSNPVGKSTPQMKKTMAVSTSKILRSSEQRKRTTTWGGKIQSAPKLVRK